MSATLSKIDLVRERFLCLIQGETSLSPRSDAATPFAVAWTGGKDSTVVLHLWREFLLEQGLLEEFGLVAVNIDTGVKFPEVLALRDEYAEKWGLDLAVARPQTRLDEEELARDPAACCRDLKIEPLKRVLEERDVAVVFTGLRADEHPSRGGRQWLEERTPGQIQCNPILEWSEMDVWSYIMDRGLPYCSLYMQGYRSLGCMPCTAAPGTMKDAPGGSEREGRNQAKERQLDTLRSLGYF